MGLAAVKAVQCAEVTLPQPLNDHYLQPPQAWRCLWLVCCILLFEMRISLRNDYFSLLMLLQARRDDGSGHVSAGTDLD